MYKKHMIIEEWIERVDEVILKEQGYN